MIETGLYIHVPFCFHRCHFCGFYLEIFQEQRAETYVQAILREIQLHVEHHSLQEQSVSSIYFGGGTPTSLPAHHLVHILDHIHEQFAILPDAEITVEAHPDTVTPSYLHAMITAGVNRISFGMQTEDRQELIRVGRPSLETLPTSVVEQARQAGLTNINLDLMYGLPGQNPETWLSTIQKALNLQPTHLSCYALTIEDDTVLDKKIQQGQLAPPSESLQNELEDIAAHQLTNHGFERYEISNYSRPGYRCRHNQHYWLGSDYLGLGPSAQSFLHQTRFGNVPNLTLYSQALEEGSFPHEGIESMSPEQALREASIFGLRLLEGIDRNRYFHTLDEQWKKKIHQFVADGLLEEHAGRIRLTPQGLRLADGIAGALY